MTYDHRLIDGREAVTFLVQVDNRERERERERKRKRETERQRHDIVLNDYVLVLNLMTNCSTISLVEAID